MSSTDFSNNADPSTSKRAPGGVRARARAQLMADLRAVARAQLAAEGPSGLSLRAVARELGVSSSAVYRYVDSRDALLTALIIEAYDEVGAVCERAAGQAMADDGDPGRAWLAVGHAFRAWALANRSSFELIYGTPVPGYAAPRDTVAAATRLWLVIETVLLTAKARGELDPAGPELDVHGLMTDEVMEFAREHVRAASGTDPASAVGPDASPTEAELARSVTLWVSLVGAVSAEVFGHLHSMTHDYARLFEVTLATAAAGLGLRVPLG
ncbi:MAG: TetR/AcrR family transcriptional regulator [Actinomycetales bacterium]|nr:TetR/AcrR family transcriptional regulator [Actinomycetales bacterium]